MSHHLPTWHLCDPDRNVIRSCAAASLTDAQRILGWKMGDSSYVTSKASHEIGTPKPLPAGRCTCCGVRTAKQGYSACERCLVRVKSDESAAQRRDPEWRRRELKRLRDRRQAKKAGNLVGGGKPERRRSKKERQGLTIRRVA